MKRPYRINIIPQLLRSRSALFVSAFSAGANSSFTEGMITAAERSHYERTSTFNEVIGVLDALTARLS